MAAGMVYLNDADIETAYSFIVTEFSGWPGNLSSASRTIPVLDGPEMQGTLVDPRTIKRRGSTATLKGIISAASASAAMTALDTLREVFAFGEVRIRTAFASDRECLAMLTDLSGEQEASGIVDGRLVVTLSFLVRDGVAWRRVPDGYALSTSRTSCPIGTAESRPIILVHGGGVAMTNPTVTVRNAAGDSVQTMTFTVSLGTTAALRIDCTRMTASIVTAGVITDALAANDWTSGDFPALRPYDAQVALGAYPTVELSSVTGTPVGEISYKRRYV